MLGAAVQTGAPFVGASAIRAIAGVGVVGTQSAYSLEHGVQALSLLRAGSSADGAIRAMVAATEAAAAERLQLGIVDVRGNASAHTGASCAPSSGQRIGDGYAVQANLMANDEVVDAVATGFEASAGPLAERLVAALVAGVDAGGDARGSQSAGLLTVSGETTAEPLSRESDLRVDDSEDAVAELERLLAVRRSYAAYGDAVARLNTGDVGTARSILTGLGDRDVMWLVVRAVALWQQGDTVAARVVRNNIVDRAPAVLEPARITALLEQILPAAPETALRFLMNEDMLDRGR
jgi:uncharacterized Ntn-hydrolase superfamily protein